MLWAQACPTAPQRVHLVFKICVFWYPEVCFHDIFFEFKRIINVKFRFQAMCFEHYVVFASSNTSFDFLDISGQSQWTTAFFSDMVSDGFLVIWT